MKKNNAKNFCKLSKVQPTATHSAAKQQLTKLTELIAQSSHVGKEIEQVVASFRQVAAPDNEPFALSSVLSENIPLIRTAFEDCDDVKFRFFTGKGREALLVYLDGMTDITLLEKNVLEILMGSKNTANTQQSIPIDPSSLEKDLITSASMTTMTNASETLDAVLTGNALLIIDGINKGFSIGSKSHVKRAIEEAKTEAVAQGAHDGFNETLSDNIVLIRRRARDTNMKIRILQLGERSKTSIALVYIANLVKPGLLEEIERRIELISTDIIIVSQTVQEFLCEHPWTPFPLLQRTERPDVVTAAIYEGRVGILVDTTPMALIAPCTYNSTMQSIDDYSAAPVTASFIRLLRHFAAFISIFMPGIYIAVVSYHPGMLPTSLAISIAELRARTPFPAFLEVLLMLVVLEIFQEAIIRTPSKIVTAASVVGGFVIGTTIVQAGISNPLLVVVMAVTAITSFSMNYSLGLAFRTLRLPIILLSSILGLYGVMLGALAILIHMCSLMSFGESYIGGLFDITLLEDWKDALVRLPIKFSKARPKQYGSQDHMRQGDKNG
ncbi:MAG: spore germination protein [Pelosinus sp.]|nr:spore germination protein [Pelosinus sp.]